MVTREIGNQRIDGRPRVSVRRVCNRDPAKAASKVGDVVGCHPSEAAIPKALTSRLDIGVGDADEPPVAHWTPPHDSRSSDCGVVGSLASLAVGTSATVTSTAAVTKATS